MYGQGNFTAQSGSMPPPFQHSPHIPPNVGQPAPPAYQQGPHVPIPPGGMFNSGQSYLNAPPPRQMQGIAPMAHTYSTSQQNFQWNQNVRHMQPLAPPHLGPPATGTSHPEMLHPLPAPRVLPPPPPPPSPSQGPVLHRGPAQPPPSGGVLGPQHTLPPLPPPPPFPSNFFIPPPFGSFMQPPPPPPSSPPPGPPPLPPSSPPPTSPSPGSGILSSAPLLTASELSQQLESGPCFNNLSVDNASRHDDISNHKGRIDGEVRSPSGGKLKLDIPPPPPKPTEEKVVQNIEILCRYIAKNGPGFEDKIRQKEFGNPEFEFLFGGEPASEAAAAHKYFLWMKNKYSSGCKFHEGQQHSESPLRPSGDDYSMKSYSMMDAFVSSSPADSDMDMEDDITQPDEEHRISKSFESQNHESDVVSSEPDTKEQLHAPQNDSERSPIKIAVSGNIFCSDSSGLVDHGEGPNLSMDHDRSASGKSLPMTESPVMNKIVAAECLLDSNLEISSVFPHEDLGQSDSSAVTAVNSSVMVPSELIKGTSPFRLLQDYASDDSSENEDKPCLEDVHPATVSTPVKVAAAELDEEMGSDFEMDLGSKGLSESEKEFRPFSESAVTFSPNVSSKPLESSIELDRLVKETDPPSIAATGKAEQLVENSDANQESVDRGVSHNALQQKNELDGGISNVPLESGKSQKEGAKSTSTQLKVDEFGRLVREGDSDSDDLRYDKRRGKRDRSWSRSPSPHDRTRNSRRRREKRSRSRSWSPKRRRSRSKSPYRRAGDFGGDKTRRDKGQFPDCFDFRRGKCYRGALCRYMHHDSDKSDGSRRYKNKLQYEEVLPSSKRASEKSVHEPNEVESQEMELLYQDLPKRNFVVAKDEDIYQREVVAVDGQLVTTGQDGESLVTAVVAESERAQEVTDLVQKIQDVKEEPTIHLPENENSLEMGKTVVPVNSFSACPVTDARTGDTSHDLLSSPGLENSDQANLSDSMLQNTDNQSQQVDTSSAFKNSSPMQTATTTIQNQLSISEPHPNQISSIQPYPPGTGSMSKPFSSENIFAQSLVAKDSLSPHVPHQSSQLPPPPPPPLVSLGTYPPFPPQHPTDFNIMQPTVIYPSSTASVENHPPYPAPFLYQHSHLAAPPNSSWNSLPPPPPPHPPFVNDLTVNSLQFQQNQLPPRNDFSSHPFVRPYPAELPTHSQVSEFQHRAYPPMHDDPGRPLFHLEDVRRRTLTQQYGGSGAHIGEGRFPRPPIQGLISSNSFSQGSMHPYPQSVPSSRESPLRRVSGDNLPTGELLTPASQSHPYFQHPSYGLQHLASDSVSTHLGEPGKINSTLSRYTSDILDRSQPSRMSNFGGSRISNYYNPYASTFDQPLRSKFTSNSFNQEKDTPYGNKYGAPFSSNHVSVDGQGVGSRNMTTSSPNSTRAFEHNLHRSSGDQYDPLFDSIEPSSNSFRKSDHGQKREATDDTEIMLNRSGSSKPQDVEENNKQKESGPVVTTSLDNDEYGETADAEVGAVENGSPSDPTDLAITGTGDVEIDQVKTPGKSKKSKDSRSMKLFKSSLADFVKEVLKPSWRQGNMSKEAFKTIVKKTVDKVSGAMKNHQIPKSQAKINQYIDSSQRKLTKLVMGYVDKYVKA